MVKNKIKSFIFITAILFSSIFIQGCRQIPAGQKDVKNTARPSSSDLVVLADQEAQRVLDEFNNSKHSHKFGGPFHLSQYKKELKESTLENRPVLIVFYELSKLPNGVIMFDGYPQHFIIWVFKDTLETAVGYGE